jgi:c-di-GMP-specific phosphodiesterase
MGGQHNTADGSQTFDDLRLLSFAVNATDRSILILGQDHRIVYVNRAFSELFGYDGVEVLGKRPTEFLPGPATNPVTYEALRRAAWEDRALSDDVLLYSKSGREIWVSTSVSPIRDSENAVKNCVIVLVDVTENKQIQHLQQVVLEAVVSGMSLASVADLLCRRVEAIAPEVRSSMLLVDSGGFLHTLAAPSLPPGFVASIDGLAVGENAGSCGTCAFLGQPVCVTDISSDPLWKDYKSLALPLGLRACWASPIKMRDGRVAGTFAFYYTEKRGPSPLHKELVSACLHLCMLAIERDEARAKIAHLSHFDTLTGLPNRTAFYEQSSELVSRANGKDVAFFAIDIDRFKDINNALGHSVGDRVLLETAYRLQKLIHSLGIVGRTSGDSFHIAIVGCDVGRAAFLADRILEVLSAPLDVSGLPLSVAASIGISIAQGDGIAPHIFAEQALSAKHQAKAAGRACFRFYSPEMNQLAMDRILFGSALREAVSSNGLRLEYQPKIHLETLDVVGVEALCRWTDAQLGEVSPSKFIALAEETGQIEAIGFWALHEACRQMAEWRRKGLPILNVAVNLTPVHFLNTNLSAFITDLLAEFELPPSCLTIEITEGVMESQNPQGLATARALHQIGVALSMDDFGTGFSSLARLTRLPLEELKLDRSFIRDFESDPSARAVITAVISLGRSLDMTVIAEGVESEKQAQWLTNLGCEFAQGYLFGESMKPAKLETWMISKIAYQPARYEKILA